jgi:hypothetical protein
MSSAFMNNADRLELTRWIICTRLLARTEEIESANTILDRTFEDKNPFQRSRLRWLENIQINLK